MSANASVNDRNRAPDPLACLEDALNAARAGVGENPSPAGEADAEALARLVEERMDAMAAWRERGRA